MTDKNLTETQFEVLRFIAVFIPANQRPPTFREVAQRFNWRSNNAANTHIKRLREKGYLTHGPELGLKGKQLSWANKAGYPVANKNGVIEWHIL